MKRKLGYGVGGLGVRNIGGMAPEGLPKKVTGDKMGAGVSRGIRFLNRGQGGPPMGRGGRASALSGGGIKETAVGVRQRTMAPTRDHPGWALTAWRNTTGKDT